jgi:hypothetical protein
MQNGENLMQNRVHEITGEEDNSGAETDADLLTESSSGSSQEVYFTSDSQQTSSRTAQCCLVRSLARVDSLTETGLHRRARPPARDPLGCEKPHTQLASILTAGHTISRIT